MGKYFDILSEESNFLDCFDEILKKNNSKSCFEEWACFPLIAESLELFRVKNERKHARVQYKFY